MQHMQNNGVDPQAAASGQPMSPDQAGQGLQGSGIIEKRSATDGHVAGDGEDWAGDGAADGDGAYDPGWDGKAPKLRPNSGGGLDGERDFGTFSLTERHKEEDE